MPSTISQKLEAEFQQEWFNSFQNANGNPAWAFGPEAAKDVLSRLLQKGVIKEISEPAVKKAPNAIHFTTSSKIRRLMIVRSQQPKWGYEVEMHFRNPQILFLSPSKTAEEFCKNASRTWSTKTITCFIIPSFWETKDIQAGFTFLTNKEKIKVLGLIPKDRKDARSLKETLSIYGIESSICANKDDAIYSIETFDSDFATPKLKKPVHQIGSSSTSSSSAAAEDHSSPPEKSFKLELM